MQMEPA